VQGRRLLLGCALVVALLGLFVHYGATADSHQRYPDNEEIALSYDDHVGETVQISGIVRPVTANESSGGSDTAGGSGGTNATDVTSATSATDGADATMAVVLRNWESFGTLTVRGADRTVPPGGSVQVIGTLAADRTIIAERVLPVNPHSWSEPYKYAVSAVGAVLILVVFFREWRLDASRLAFEVREDG